MLPAENNKTGTYHRTFSETTKKFDTRRDKILPICQPELHKAIVPPSVLGLKYSLSIERFNGHTINWLNP